MTKGRLHLQLPLVKSFDLGSKRVGADFTNQSEIGLFFSKTCPYSTSLLKGRVWVTDIVFALDILSIKPAPTPYFIPHSLEKSASGWF